MLDYPAARAVALVIQTGSFERAAAVLGVTPSAVSQRVKGLEERLGAPLILRGAPCTATRAGARLCRHVERLGLLERGLFAELGLADGQAQPVTLPVAANADSLGTWLLPALAGFARETDNLLDIAVDDEGHTADWLSRGRVMAAVTADPRPVRGCRVLRLGALRYRATASPAFLRRHFPAGVDAGSLARAPALTFNRKDRLQARWVQQALGQELAFPTHWLPSTQGFVTAAREGMGWALNPAPLVDADIAAGHLAELLPGVVLDVPLFWQVSRLSSGALAGLTGRVTRAARAALLPVA